MVACDLGRAAAFQDDCVDDVVTEPDMSHLRIWWPELCLATWLNYVLNSHTCRGYAHHLFGGAAPPPQRAVRGRHPDERSADQHHLSHNPGYAACRVTGSGHDRVGVDEPRPRDVRGVPRMIVTVALILSILEIPLWGVISLTFLAAWPFPGEAPPSVNPWTGACFLLTLLNLFAVVAFASHRRGYSYWLLALVQALDVVALFVLRVVHGPFDEFASNVMLAVAVASCAAVLLLGLSGLRTLARMQRGGKMLSLDDSATERPQSHRASSDPS